MKSQKQLKRLEYILYAILLFLLFIAPTISTLFHGHDIEETDFLWRDLLLTWKNLAIFVIAFIIHDIFIAPFLIQKHKPLYYILSLAVLVTVFQLYQCSHRPDRPLPPGKTPPEKEMVVTDKNAAEFKQDSLRQPVAPPPIHRHDIISFILLISGLGTNIGIKLYVRSLGARKHFEELEKENLEQKLEHLKYQLQPHFFMNTLNNIHALVDIDPDKAQKCIIDLSKLMRYVLYESNVDFVQASKEIEFMSNYVNLMRIRYNEKLSFSVITPDDGTSVWVPPLIFISFVENAFKHGVSNKNNSFIDIIGNIYKTESGENRLKWSCTNSKYPKKSKKDIKESSGVGLTNIKHRLDLIFGDNYTLDIKDEENIFSVVMDIPVKTVDPNI